MSEEPAETCEAPQERKRRHLMEVVEALMSIPEVDEVWYKRPEDPE